MKLLVLLSEIMILLMISYITGFGLLSGCPVLDNFIGGARDDMKIVADTLPTLVGLLVSVGVLRTSGLLDFLGELLQMPAALLHILPQIVPVVLVCLAFNSTVTGLALDTFREYGTDSLPGLITPIPISSTEIVLYCLSVYLGSVGTARIRYTLTGGLIVTAAGMVASVVLAGMVG